MQATHTYTLIEAEIFMEAKKKKQREDRHYQMLTSGELLPCVPFCLLLVKVSHFTVFLSSL